MTFRTSIGQNASKMRQQDRWWTYLFLALLIVAAFVVYAINLGGLSLSLEEIVTAELAHKILQAPPHSWRWIFLPILGKANILQPPLFYDLVAFSYKIGNFSSLTTRLPSALLGTVSTAILYGIGREIFKVTPPALLACCVYITLFPVISQGRLGTIDAPLLCLEMFTLWAALRSRRDLRWTLITGFGLCLVGLTHSWSFICLLILLLGFLYWDTPRLLVSSYFYFGLILGMMPLIAWWIAQMYYLNPGINPTFYLAYSNLKVINIPQLQLKLLSHRSVNDYLARILQYCSPWSIVTLYGLRLAWHYRIWGWAKFILSIIGATCLFSFLAIANSNWYLLPVYPALALAAGMQLYQIFNLPSYLDYPRLWVSIFNCLAIVICLLGLSSNLIFELDFSSLLWVIFGSIILTLLVASLCVIRRDIQFVYVLIWGSYFSLLVFFISPYWIS